MSISQGDIFRGSEGDAWYSRNVRYLADAERVDVAMVVLDLIAAKSLDRVTSICDVGCADGWRLDRLARRLPQARRLCGFDASAAAVASGVSRGGHDLRVGLVENGPFDEPFDLVIVGFVLHWVDRTQLARAIGNIERLVAPGGFLILLDFLPDAPHRRPYHHLGSDLVFTYKQDYAGEFTAHGAFEELARVTFAHDRPDEGVQPVATDDRAVCSLLYKLPGSGPSK